MGARPPFLAGRDFELAYFDEMLRQLQAGGTQKHPVLTGLHGVGKTVLLNEFEERCSAAGWPGETREIVERSRLAHIVAKAARKALLEMSAARKSGDAVRRALGALKAFSLTVGEMSFRFDVDALDGVADSGDLAEDMRDLLIEVGLAARAHGVGFALILDEMQNLAKGDLEALIVGLHRTKQKGLPVAFVGAGLPLLPDLTGEAKSYAERGFEFRRVGALEEAAAVAALREPATGEGVTWEERAMRRVVHQTQGYPYFLQEYGREIWKIHSGLTIGLQLVKAAEPIVLEYLDDNFFSQRIGKLPDAERRYMWALASLGDGPQRSSEVSGAMGKQLQEVSVVRDRLIKASLLSRLAGERSTSPSLSARTTSAGIHIHRASRSSTSCGKSGCSPARLDGRPPSLPRKVRFGGRPGPSLAGLACLQQRNDHIGLNDLHDITSLHPEECRCG